MNWRSHAPVHYRGRAYGQKDREFAKFIDVPRATEAPLELAVSGNDVPHDRLAAAGWRLRTGSETTRSVAAFYDYLRASRGELGVCKEVFVYLRTGWFSDRSAAYLACGRPVVLQDTGFGNHLPSGEGLFAVETADDAAAAIEEINRDYPRHARRAREIATEFLDAPKVLTNLLNELGVRRG
jgi:glycosyltransferase involved in cell wall biosynthesis